MEIAFYRSLDKNGREIKLQSNDAFQFTKINAGKEFKIFNKNIKLNLGKILKYQFLGNMLLVVAETGRHYFIIICN